MFVMNEGLTFHELADLQFCTTASHFVGELLNRLTAVVNDDMLTHVSMTFDRSEHENLIADYEVAPAEAGFPAMTTIKRQATPITRVVALVNAFTDPIYRPTIISLFGESKQEDKPRTDKVISQAKAFLRYTETEPLPAFMPK
jgi:hypothetical protein